MQMVEVEVVMYCGVSRFVNCISNWSVISVLFVHVGFLNNICMPTPPIDGAGDMTCCVFMSDCYPSICLCICVIIVIIISHGHLCICL